MESTVEKISLLLLISLTARKTEPQQYEYKFLTSYWGALFKKVGRVGLRFRRMKLAGFGDLFAPGFATSSVSEQLSVSTQIKTFCNVSDIIIHFMLLGFERLLNVAA